MPSRVFATLVLAACLWACACASCGPISNGTIKDDPIAVIHERLVEFFLDNGDCTQNDPLFCAAGGCQVACDSARQFLSTLKDDFSWPDIDYKDETRSVWNASIHMSRVVVMARALQCPGCHAAYHAPALRNAAVGALLYWFKHDFQNPNWWWNDFGIPQLTETAVFLLDPATLSAPTLAKAISILKRANGSYTGANLVWSLQITIGRAVLTNDLAMLTTAFQQLWAGIFFTLPPAADGIQIDGSFFQHGPLLQSGTYGADFGMDTVTYVHLARDTAVAIDDRALAVLATFWLDGEQYMMRWNGQRNGSRMFWDVNVKGREISRAPSGMVGVNSDPLLCPLAAMAGPRAAEFQALAARMAGEGDVLVGSRHYWLADYTVHHRRGFFLSVRTHSNRTYASECVNSENLLGWHMADGATFIMQRGDEYSGIFPVWSWTRIPGITARQDVKEEECNFSNKVGTTSFVGGICSDDLCLSAMDFRAANNGAPGEADEPLTARKAWFLLNEGMIALAANITLPIPGAVTTTLDQCLLSGPVYVSLKGNVTEVPPGAHVFDRPEYFWHNNVAYIIKPPSRVLLRNDVATGSWRNISTAGSPALEKMKTFTLEIDHGSGPRGDVAYYAVLPNVSLADSRAVWANISQRTLLINTASTQALRTQLNATDTMTFIAAYEPGTVAFEDGFVATVSQPSLWILTETKGRGDHTLTVAAASPHHASSLRLVLPVALTGGSKDVKCASEQSSPLGADASSVTVTLPSEPALLGSTVRGVCVFAA